MLRNKHEALCLKGLQAFCRKQDRRDSWQHKSIRKNVCFHCAGGEIEFCSKSVASGGAEKKWQPTPKRNTMVKAWTSSSSCNKITSSSACIWENFGFWRLVFVLPSEDLNYCPKRQILVYIQNYVEFWMSDNASCNTQQNTGNETIPFSPQK